MLELIQVASNSFGRIIVNPFFAEKDISRTLARFTFVSTDVWFWRLRHLAPALLINLGIRLFRESEASVVTFCPFNLIFFETFPVCQVIKTLNC